MKCSDNTVNVKDEENSLNKYITLIKVYTLIKEQKRPTSFKKITGKIFRISN